MTCLAEFGLSLWLAAVAGRRMCRDSCLRLEMPASLLKDAFDLDAFWLLEKLLVLVLGSMRRDHILGTVNARRLFIGP